MKIAFLGHAGFCIESKGAVLIADPWLSPSGAFDASWFQLPSNHHLAAFVEERLSLPKAEKFIYVSHEHEDHYDRAFLDSLNNRDFTLIVPRYRRTCLRRSLQGYRCRSIVALEDGETVRFPGGELKLYLDDSELNRDSALLFRADDELFLNLNDCRIFDRLAAIQEQEGKVDVFTCQFSGASWHPTCYQYSEEDYERISTAKVMSKFKAVDRGVDLLKPRFFIPSAGPVCFLDPELFAINFRKRGIFRRAPDLFEYMTATLEDAGTAFVELTPGDILDVSTGSVDCAPGERYDDAHFEEYVSAYAASYRAFFEERKRANDMVDARETLDALLKELSDKLALLSLRHRIDIPLYFGLVELHDCLLRVDFKSGTIEQRSSIPESEYYSITAHAWQISKVLRGELSWEHFGLSFRVSLLRLPDQYQPLIHAYITMDKGDLYRFCLMLADIELRTDRIEVTAGGKVYTVNRFCPHNGGDLAEGWVEDDRYLVCARHRWCFDLQNAGRCTTNASSVYAELQTEEAAELDDNGSVVWR